MRRFSNEEDRRYVFDPLGQAGRAPKVQEGDWIDLYQLLDIAPDAPIAELDEKIIERGADAVFFAFSKNGKPQHMIQLEKHLPEMRPILLDPAVRRRYDEQLALHRNNTPGAMSYDAFLQTLDRREYSGCLSTLLVLVLPSAAWLISRATDFPSNFWMNF